MSKLLSALGGRKFVVFLAVVGAVVLKAAGLNVDVDTIIAAGAVYTVTEGVADVVSRVKG